MVSSEGEHRLLTCDQLGQSKGIDQQLGVLCCRYSNNQLCEHLTVEVSDLEAVDKIISGKQLINHKLETMLPTCFI